MTDSVFNKATSDCWPVRVTLKNGVRLIGESLHKHPEFDGWIVLVGGDSATDASFNTPGTGVAVTERNVDINLRHVVMIDEGIS